MEKVCQKSINQILQAQSASAIKRGKLRGTKKKSITEMEGLSQGKRVEIKAIDASVIDRMKMTNLISKPMRVLG